MEKKVIEFLQGFRKKSGLISDYVANVASKLSNGLYVHGPPGTGKTHTARTTLEGLEVPYHYCNGHMTPLGLFDTLGEHSDAIIIIDDVSSLFNNDQSLSILMAALGGQPGGDRVVKYYRSGKRVSIHFSGGLVLLSNMYLKNGPLQQALASRVYVQLFDPAEEELEAFLRDHTKDGFVNEGQHRVGSFSLSADECELIIDHVLKACKEFSCRLDIRLVLTKAFPLYAQWTCGNAQTDWRDLVDSTVKDKADEITRTVEPAISKQEELSQNRGLAGKLKRLCATREELERQWKERTGKSTRTLDRHLRAIKLQGNA